MVPEKEIFKVFLPDMGSYVYFGHVTNIMLMNFISLFLQAYIQNLAENDPVVTNIASSSFTCK